MTSPSVQPSGEHRALMAHPLFDAMSPRRESALSPTLKQLVCAFERCPLGEDAMVFGRVLDDVADALGCQLHEVGEMLLVLERRRCLAVTFYATTKGLMAIVSEPSNRDRLQRYLFNFCVDALSAPKRGDAA